MAHYANGFVLNASPDAVRIRFVDTITGEVIASVAITTETAGQLRTNLNSMFSLKEDETDV